MPANRHYQPRHRQGRENAPNPTAQSTPERTDTPKKQHDSSLVAKLGFVGLCCLPLAACLTVPPVYSSIRDHLDPGRVDRRTIGTNAGDVFARRHVKVDCEPGALASDESGVHVKAKLEPGGYIYAAKQADTTPITIRLSRDACNAMITLGRHPADPANIAAALPYVKRIVEGVDRTTGPNADPRTGWWNPDEALSPTTDAAMRQCHIPQETAQYLIIAGTPEDLATQTGREEAATLGTTALEGCFMGGPGDMHLSQAASLAMQG